MNNVRSARRASRSGALLLVALVGVACGPERPPVPGPSAAATPPPAAGRKDLPASAYQVEWGPVLVPATLKAGERVEVAVTLKNVSTTSWPANGNGELYVVRLGNRWLDAKGQVVDDFGERRAELPGVLDPGGSVTLTAALVAPTRPGDYVVQFDLVHEGVIWFSDHGAARQLTPVKVQ